MIELRPPTRFCNQVLQSKGTLPLMLSENTHTLSKQSFLKVSLLCILCQHLVGQLPFELQTKFLNFRGRIFIFRH